MVVALLVAGAVAAAPAHAQLLAPASPTDPSPYLDWPALLAPLPGPAKDPSERDCIEGEPSCIDRTIEEMEHRMHTVVPVCDHRVVFSLAYLRVTEDIRDAARAGVFRDPRWLQNEDRVFARLYFDAYDDYAAERFDRLPAAWRMTFDAAKDREMGAFGNFLMSMNAHINRDFPYVLDGVGIRRPDGTSRKRDHDVYNRRLAALYEPVLREVAERFDPVADDGDIGMVDNEIAFALLQSWREGVWRNAERLTNARTEGERRQVGASIEAYAASVGRVLLETFRYRDGGAQRAARDAWCAQHGGQDPGREAASARPGRAFLFGPRRTLLRRDRTIRVRVGCPQASTGCRGRARIQRGRRRVGLRRLALRPGEQRTLAVRLGARTARDVRRRRRLRMRVALDWAGVPGTGPRRTVTVVAPRKRTPRRSAR
jgi:hypothetical protein